MFQYAQVLSSMPISAVSVLTIARLRISAKRLKIASRSFSIPKSLIEDNVVISKAVWALGNNFAIAASSSSVSSLSIHLSRIP